MSRALRALRLVTAGGVLLASASIAAGPAVAVTAHHRARGPVWRADVGASTSRSATAVRTAIAADGTTTTVEKRTVRVTVAQTRDLRSLQLVHVSWTGAHPTGGLVADQNSDLAQNEEFPMVLLECRGVDSTGVPIADRLSQRTCWTQYADERFSYGYGAKVPAWRADSAATPAQRAALVNAPAAASLPATCARALAGTSTQHWLPFDAADGTSYPGGPEDCAGGAPEASPSNLSSLSLPSNETFGVTAADGTGSADFDVFTAEDHASLGCSATVPCSLVAVPIVGLSCDPYGTLLPAAQRPSATDAASAAASCEAAPNFTPGETLPAQGAGQPAVDGSLWWSPSNWANRITVPLHFAPPDNACGLGGSGPSLDVYGSELMIQAATSWAPHFCLDSSLFDFSHVQTPEPQATNLLNTGNIQAAFASDVPAGGYTAPTVTAPVAVTGFGIAFDVDDGSQRQVTTLRLDARLLAKLLTESYPSQTFVRTTYDALANNPLNITMDPEFQALNPGIPQTVGDAAATLLTVNTDSDVMTALTSYIDADPVARAWLDGQADPWGMVVNPNYKGIDLPVANWPLLDTFEPRDEYQPGKNDCLYADPVPYLPLVASPTARLFSIGQDMQFALSQSQTTCVLPSPIPGSLAGAKLVANGRQSIGHRFMLGVVSLGDAAREGLHIADLETQSSLSGDPQLTSADGLSFAPASQASLLAAAHLMVAQHGTGLLRLPYAALRTGTAGASAYPGTMVVNLAAPLQGLTRQQAGEVATLLRFAAGPGQDPGTGQGQLPAGYVPMTSANGLSSFVTATSHAATAVAAQQGTLHPTRPTPTPTPSPSPSPSPSTGGTTSPTPAPTPVTTAPPVVVPTPPVITPAPVPTTPSTPPVTATSTPAVAAPTTAPPVVATRPVSALTPSIGAGVGGIVLPIVLALMILGGLSSVVVRLVTAKGAGR